MPPTSWTSHWANWVDNNDNVDLTNRMVFASLNRNQELDGHAVVLDPITGLNTDKSTNAPHILAITGFFATLTLIVVLARFYVRSVMLKTTGTDDWIMMAAMACGVVVFVCFIGETRHGIGMHTNAISPTDATIQRHWQFVRLPELTKI